MDSDHLQYRQPNKISMLHSQRNTCTKEKRIQGTWYVVLAINDNIPVFSNNYGSLTEFQTFCVNLPEYGVRVLVVRGVVGVLQNICEIIA
jgi:hypothetical protein